MKFHKAWLATGAALAMGATPGLAADWGGIKDMGGGVAIPVPAPAPVPTYDVDSDWYVGISIGGDISTDASVTDLTSTGLYIPTKNQDDVGMQPTFGLNFGRYITPSLRWDISVDYHRDASVNGPSTSIYSDTKSDVGQPVLTTIDVDGTPTQVTVPSYDTNHYIVTRKEETLLNRTTGLVSLFYDFDTGTRFTPYIGGGVGFSWRRMKRNYSDNAVCDYSTNTLLDYPTNNCVIQTTNLPQTYGNSGSTTKDRIDLAAAVQAGIATNITEQVIWDNGWQMLWEGGAISTTVPLETGDPANPTYSTVKYKDAVIQQFRSGLRIKFD